MKIFSRIFFILLALLLAQCNDPPVSPINIEPELHKGGKGGGGHTETQSNNLSFPALLADGVTLPQINESLTVPYDGNYEGLTAEEVAALGDQPWYAQKVAGNVWQGEFKQYNRNNNPVTFIDWGDAMESVDPKLRRPYRVEFGVYVKLSIPMSAYTMALLAFPSSKDETQGTDGSRYNCEYATIASPKGRVVIQRYDEDATLEWNPAEGKWDGAYEPESGFGFQQELNVGGKYIYGASTGGFVPTVAGNYRITFYFQDSEVSLVGALVGDYNGGAPIIPKNGENNTAKVMGDLNLTYMDVQATGGGGGGSGGKGGGSKGKGK